MEKRKRKTFQCWLSWRRSARGSLKNKHWIGGKGADWDEHLGYLDCWTDYNIGHYSTVHVSSCCTQRGIPTHFDQGRGSIIDLGINVIKMDFSMFGGQPGFWLDDLSPCTALLLWLCALRLTAPFPQMKSATLPLPASVVKTQLQTTHSLSKHIAQLWGQTAVDWEWSMHQ